MKPYVEHCNFIVLQAKLYIIDQTLVPRVQYQTLKHGYAVGNDDYKKFGKT